MTSRATAIIADAVVNGHLETQVALKGLRALRLVSTAPCRIRAYGTDAHRDADVARAPGVDPLAGSGVLLDVVLVIGLLDITLSPAVDLHTQEATSTIPFLVSTDISTDLDVTLHYQPTET